MRETPPFDQASDELEEPNNWTLIRDIAVIQFKLVVDGLRDLLLVPATLVIGIVSLLSGSQGKPGPYFYKLLSWGKQSERWINLFGALGHAPEEIRASETLTDASLDDVVAYVESVVIKEHRAGTMTRQAKQHIDRALANIQGDQKPD